MDQDHGEAPGRLPRRVGLFSAAMLVAANMIGAGIFTASGLVLQRLGDPGRLLLAWGLGGALALLGAFCYGRLGAALPRAGGDYAYLRHCFGPRLAFLSGWVSLLAGFSAPIAATALALAGHALRLSPPGWRVQWSWSWGGWSGTVGAQDCLAVAAIAGLTLLHALSLRGGLGVQNILTALKLLALAALITGGLGWGPGPVWEAGPEAPPPPPLWQSLPGAMVLVYYAYSGFNAAAYLGGEVKRPEATLPRAALLGASLVTALYLLVNLAYVWALAPREMAGELEVGAALAQAVGGPAMGRIMAAVLSLCLFSNLGAMIVVGPRVYYAMAQDGVLLPGLARLGRSSGLPARAVVLQGGLASAMVLTASFEGLLIYIGLTLSVFSSLSVLGLLRLPGRGGAGALWPLLYAAGNLGVVGLAWWAEPVSAWPALITLALGLGLYELTRRLRFARGHG